VVFLIVIPRPPHGMRGEDIPPVIFDDMKTSDDLFRLVKSLSKTEKRYFRLFASMQRGEKKYLLLFDAIEAQEEYDEAELRERFKQERFVRQFNVAKKYLYEQILKVLRLYHDDSSARARIRDMIASAEILYEKGMSDQAVRMIDRAIHHAREHQLMGYAAEALKWRAYLVTNDCTSAEEWGIIFEEIEEGIDMFRNIAEYERLEMTFCAANGNTAVRSADDLEPVEEFANNELLRDESRALTLRSRIIRHYIVCHYHFIRRDFDEALLEMTRALELYKEHDAYRASNLLSYCCGLHNAIFLSRRANNYGIYREASRALREVADGLALQPRLATARIHGQILFSTYSTLASEAIILGRFEDVTSIAPEIDRELELHSAYLSDGRRQHLYLVLSSVYFCSGDLARALDYINRILAEPELANGRAISYHARIAGMMIHFELGNIELLPYLVRSAYRYFRSRQRIYRFETVILSFFRALPNVATHAELMAMFTRLRKDLEELAADPHEYPMLELFPYLQWLKSKVERRDIGEVMRSGAAFDPYSDEINAAA
jgi:hypothetical protein